MATTPTPITGASVPRQVLPFGDRPLGYVRDGQVYATMDFFQWFQRLAGGFGSTVQNVDTVITTVNEVVTDVSAIEAQVSAIDAELVVLQDEIDAIGPAQAGAPPAAPFPLRFSLPPPAPAPRLVAPAAAPPQSDRGGGVTFGQAFALSFFLGG